DGERTRRGVRTRDPERDTINLDQQVYTLTPSVQGVPFAAGGQSALPVITTPITIEGNGATIRRDPSLECQLDGRLSIEEFRLFELRGPNAQLTLNDVTLKHGCADDSALDSANAIVISGGFGGAIRNSSPNSVIIRDATISQNSAIAGGGIVNFGAPVANPSDTDSAALADLIASPGRIEIQRSNVSNNLARSAGGIGNIGTMEIVDSTVAKNEADVIGGIVNEGTLRLQASAVKQNAAAVAGGIDNRGDMVLRQSTVSGNSATRDISLPPSPPVRATGPRAAGVDGHGAVWGLQQGDQGDSDTQRTRIVNSTISNNEAKRGGGIFSIQTAPPPFPDQQTPSLQINHQGGGIVSINASVQLLSSTVARNGVSQDGSGIYLRIAAGETRLQTTVEVANSIVSSPSLSSSCRVDVNSGINPNHAFDTLDRSEGPSGVTTPNLDSDGSCPTFSQSDVNPKLGPLEDHGGPTKTHAIAMDSPALNAALACPPPETDQRGVSRPQGMSCDLGAYEKKAKTQVDMDPGEDVRIVFPVQGLNAEFAEVTSSGTVRCESASSAPFGSFDAEKAASGFMDCDADASFAGGVTITVTYDDTGLSTEAEQALKLLRVVERDGEVIRQDITETVNTQANRIVGRAEGFSFFVVGNFSAGGGGSGGGNQPQQQPLSVQFPTLTEWGMLALALLFVGLMPWAIRRRRRTSRPR
ncbi:MAG: choice-of-anchor Q domain-containing protein, partial [Salinibacter sp.]